MILNASRGFDLAPKPATATPVYTPDPKTREAAEPEHLLVFGPVDAQPISHNRKHNACIDEVLAVDLSN